MITDEAQLKLNTEYGKLIKKLKKTGQMTKGIYIDISKFQKERIQSIKRLSGEGFFKYIGITLGTLAFTLLTYYYIAFIILIASIVIMPLSWFLFFRKSISLGMYSGDYTDFILMVILIIYTVLFIYNYFKETGGRYYSSKKKAIKKIQKLEDKSIIVIKKSKDNPKYLECKKALDEFMLEHPEYESISYDFLEKVFVYHYFYEIIFYESHTPNQIRMMLENKRKEIDISYENWQINFEKTQAQKKEREQSENLERLVKLEEERLKEQKRHNAKVEWDLTSIKYKRK